MKSFDAATSNYIGGRDYVIVRHLLWFRAKNRTTGAEETLGLWNGIDAQQFTVDGEVRDYFGAGSLLDIEPITSGVRLDVRMLQVSLNDLTPEVSQLLRGYDARLAPVEIHRALLDHEARQLIAPPVRVFQGWIDQPTIRTGERHEAKTSLASDARRLTRTVDTFRSDAAMRQRNGSDGFRRYTDVAGQIPVWWGSERQPGERG